MSKTRVKLFMWAILFLGGTAGALLVLIGLANLTAFFQQGADPATALNIVPNVPVDLNVRVRWLTDDADTGRQLEPFTRTQIESAYLRAWLQWNLSYRRNEPYGLKTYFAGPALADVQMAVSQSAAAGWKITQADSAHNLQAHFYSADGSIVSFTDHDALVAQTIRDSSNTPIYAGETRADYDVVMFLEDGNWRVRHWVRTNATAFVDSSIGQLQTPRGFVGVQETRLMIDGERFDVAGVNYYPQATPWDLFWLKYEARIIDQDFERIQTLGLNTIRIFIPFEQFGGPRVNPAMLDRLADLLMRAQAHRLKVIITLFDFRADYDPLYWPAADRQLETLLTRFSDNAAILAWDLKNEPDLDYASAGREMVNGWLAHSARLARLYDPHHLLTIGWSSPTAALAIADSVDFVSFHFYAPASELAAQYAVLKNRRPAQPILLSEFGLPTWNSFFFPNGHSEIEQAEYYADVLSVARKSDTAGYLAWTLYDFNTIPSSVVGPFPWQTEPQKYLGVIRSDGRAKPAAQLLAPKASVEVTRLPGWARFLKPFWLTVIALLFFIGRLVVRLRQRRKRHPRA